MVPLKAHILVADDMSEICELLRSVLEAEGYRVTSATDAPEALGVIQTQHLDLAILDASMPGKGGGLLADIAESGGVPTILMSGHPASLENLAASHRTHLRKPFSIVHLMQVIGNHFGESPARADCAPLRRTGNNSGGD